MSNMGHAHLALAEFDKAEECYERLRKLGKDKLADTYMERLTTSKAQAERRLVVKNQLKNDKSKESVQDMVQKLLAPNKEIIYYHGGLTLLEATG